MDRRTKSDKFVAQDILGELSVVRGDAILSKHVAMHQMVVVGCLDDNSTVCS
jgi:hypothetical protein